MPQSTITLIPGKFLPSPYFSNMQLKKQLEGDANCINIWTTQVHDLLEKLVDLGYVGE